MSALLNATDNELIKLFRSGNDSALEVLVQKYKDRIFSSLYYLSKDRELAEDLFQEVFIKIIDTVRSDRYNDEGKFLPWALRISHNLYIDYFRKYSKHRIINCGDNTQFEHVTPLIPSADSKIMKLQTYEKLNKMLDKLPEEQREVVVLRHFGELSFKEIAELTKTSLNTCLGRMRYALINLRKEMVEHNITL